MRESPHSRLKEAPVQPVIVEKAPVVEEVVEVASPPVVEKSIDIAAEKKAVAPKGDSFIFWTKKKGSS